MKDLVERVINGMDLTLEYLEKCKIISRSADGKWIMKKVASVLNQSEEIHKGELLFLFFFSFLSSFAFIYPPFISIYRVYMSCDLFLFLFIYLYLLALVFLCLALLLMCIYFVF